MPKVPDILKAAADRNAIDKPMLLAVMDQFIAASGYQVEELTTGKPWGAGFRFRATNAERFLAEFFPEIELAAARGNIENAELSPKFLLVLPGQRLSWQYHRRRAEIWRFLTPGAYIKSETDEQGVVLGAAVGDMVSFRQRERHRLIGAVAGYTLVAEVWQHTDPTHPSDEDDIVRLQDDYLRD